MAELLDRDLATRPASIGTPGRHQSESVADIASERLAEIIGISRLS